MNHYVHGLNEWFFLQFSYPQKHVNGTFPAHWHYTWVLENQYNASHIGEMPPFGCNMSWVLQGVKFVQKSQIHKEFVVEPFIFRIFVIVEQFLQDPRICCCK